MYNLPHVYAYARIYPVSWYNTVIGLRRINEYMQHIVTIWKLGRTVCVYSMVQRREKEKDSRYMDETSAPAAVTVYQICNISPTQVYL